MVTMHGLNFSTASVPFTPGERSFEAALIKTLNEQGILLTCVGSGVERTIEQEIGSVDANRIRVIPNGVDLAVTPGRDRNDERSRLGLSPGALVIANVGSMDRRRDQVLLVRAFALLAREHPDWRCVIAGDGPLKGDLIHLVDELGLSGKVSFLGQIPHEDVISLLNAADICAVSSANEGFGLPMLEARSVGTPLVTFADLDVVNDLYDSDVMVLVNAHTPSDFRDGLLQAAIRNWDRTKIRESANRYGLATMAAQYDEASGVATPMKCSLTEFEDRLFTLTKEYATRFLAEESVGGSDAHG
jgi:glycosyltransferase involved in cell wall biosynthesis